MSANVISLTKVHKAFGPRVILDEVTFGLDAGEHLGLIGDNGTGKSTFLRIMAGLDPPDGGTVAIRGGTRIALLDQAPDLGSGRTVRQVLEAPFARVVEAIAAYERAATEQDPSAEHWLTQIDQLGGWDWSHRVEKVASQLGVTDLVAAVETLSGGQAKRVAFAELLLSDPDVALLDEPTNHLDAETIEWIETWLADTPCACVLVTHDRYFLERVVTRMAELHDGTLRSYEGRYSDYLLAREAEEEQRGRVAGRRLQMLKAEIDWARRSPKARTTKQKARLGRVDDLDDEVKTLSKQVDRAAFSFGNAPALGRTIMEIVDVTKRYDEGTPLVEHLTLLLRKGDRVGIIGANGSGKTTLLRMILGDVEPDEGSIRLGTKTRVAYLDQHRAGLDLEATIRDTICPNGGDKVFVGGQPVHVVSWLERFAFRSEAHRMKVGRLSGGERNRLSLAKFLLSDANVLLLDEPTNDLDLPTMHVLEEALTAFAGCVLVVTHDRWFLDRVSTHVMAFEDLPEGGREVNVFAGDYTTYRRLRLSELEQRRREQLAREKAARAAEVTPASEAAASKKAKLTWSEERELAELGPRVEALEIKVTALEAQLSEAGVWEGDGSQGRALQAEHDAAQAELDSAFERWAALDDAG